MPVGGTETIIAWKFKGLSYKIIKSPTGTDKSVSPKLKWLHNSKIAVEFNGSYL